MWPELGLLHIDGRLGLEIETGRELDILFCGSTD